MKHIVVIDSNQWFEEYYSEISSWSDVQVLSHAENTFAERNDPQVHYHVWAQEAWFPVAHRTPQKRACRISLRYIEQIPLRDASEMSAFQQAWFRLFLSRAADYDEIYVASTESRLRLHQLLPKLANSIVQIPLGHTLFLGAPDFECKQDIDVLAYGTPIPRRMTALSLILPLLGDLTVHAQAGIWGKTRNALIRRAKILLHIQTIPGLFPSIRTWRALANGAFWMTEEVSNPFPFILNEDFVQIPTINEQTAQSAAQSIREWIGRDSDRNALRKQASHRAAQHPVRDYFDEIFRRMETKKADGSVSYPLNFANPMQKLA